MFPRSTTQRLLVAAWYGNRQATAKLVLSDSALTAKLTKAQVERLSEIAGVGKR